MDIVAEIIWRAHSDSFASTPGPDQIGAEARLLERSKRVGDKELTERYFVKRTPVAENLSRQGFGESIWRKCPHWLVAGTLVCLENAAGEDDRLKAPVLHELKDGPKAVGIFGKCLGNIEVEAPILPNARRVVTENIEALSGSNK